MTDEQLLIHIESFQNLVVGIATGGARDDDADREYSKLRKSLVGSRIDSQLPRFVRTCRDTAQFWSHITSKYPTYDGVYADRKEHLRGLFRPLIDQLEGYGVSPADAPISEALRKLDAQHVGEAWDKALSRRHADPEGAITSARTLLETVCKHVLDAEGITYKRNADLSDLCKATGAALNLAPEQHQEAVFKQILTGCYTVVGGLAALRNGLSDAHGKPTQAIKPAPRHARLAVDLAGSIAAFFVDTWEARQKG